MTYAHSGVSAVSQTSLEIHHDIAKNFTNKAHLIINDIWKISGLLILILFAENTNIICTVDDLQQALGRITQKMVKLRR